MGLAERALGSVVQSNNRRLAARAADRDQPNPRDLSAVAWNTALESSFPTIRAAWDRFVADGRRLPRIEDLIDEHQGNEGDWRAGLLVSHGRPVGLAPSFPETLAALAVVPGLWSALWSELDAGAELPEHTGPNAGMLRYHLGVRCGPDTALQVAGTVTPYREGVGILFDDTAPHAAWNRGTEPRVTLFLEILRPAAGATAVANVGVQRLLALDPRYRHAPDRAREWDVALNRG